MVSSAPDGPAANRSSSSSLIVLIAGIAGGLVCLGVCVAGAVFFFCLSTKSRSSSKQQPISIANASNAGYNQELSPEAQARNEFVKGNVVRTAPDSKVYVDALSRESEQVNRDPARYANEVHTVPQKLYVDRLSSVGEQANDESKRYTNV